MRPLLLLLALAACNPPGVDTADTAVPVEACQPVIEPVEISWSACDVSSGSGDGAAECAWVDMPMHHCDPGDGLTMEVAVKRYRSSDDAPAQVWFLQGGPGGSGLDILQTMGSSIAGTGYDFYVIDHRGVGESTRLSCPDQEWWGSEEGAAITAEEAIACAPAPSPAFHPERRWRSPPARVEHRGAYALTSVPSKATVTLTPALSGTSRRPRPHQRSIRSDGDAHPRPEWNIAALATSGATAPPTCSSRRSGPRPG